MLNIHVIKKWIKAFKRRNGKFISSNLLNFETLNLDQIGDIERDGDDEEDGDD